jgi:hypothetical protein
MSDMERVESIERYREGLKKAADCCRQLGAAQKNRQWNQIAFNLEGILQKGTTIYRNKSISRSDALAMIDRKVEIMKADLNG